MDWSAPTWWWLATGTLVAAELATGTFYLLMLALGTLAAACSAHMGGGVVAQWLLAALVGAGTTGLWHWKRSRRPAATPVARNRDLNIDIGQTVYVPAWAADGSARVQYRGSSWVVRVEGDGPGQAGEHVIVSVHSGHLGVLPKTAAAGHDGAVR